MPHNIDKMVYAGSEVPWHGLGTQLPRNADYDSIVEAAGFYRAIEREITAQPMEGPIPDKKALFRDDTSAFLAVVNKSYEVIQFVEVARTLVEAAGGVRCIFHTAGTLGPNGVRGWLLGELPNVIQVRGDKSPIKKYVLAYMGACSGPYRSPIPGHADHRFRSKPITCSGPCRSPIPTMPITCRAGVKQGGTGL